MEMKDDSRGSCADMESCFVTAAKARLMSIRFEKHRNTGKKACENCQYIPDGTSAEPSDRSMPIQAQA